MAELRVTERYEAGVGTVAEIWEDDLFVGGVYWRDETVIIEIEAPRGEDEVLALDVDELLRALETASAMVVPDDSELGVGSALPTSPGQGEEDEFPGTTALTAEFDSKARYRSDGYAGFFARPVALEFVRRCDALDLAVVTIEGYELMDDELTAIRGLNVDLGSAHAGSPWATFRASCNIQAEATLERWPRRDDLVVSFEVQEPGGDVFVA